MITERKLKQIADRQDINSYYQEKDYLQNIFLYQISGNENLVFKGGTCLKICYNLPRFSEDLDFNTELSPEEIEATVKNALKGFRKLGIEVEIERSEKFKKTSSYTAHLRFKGPLYKESRSSTNTIQIDAGRRTETVLEPDVKQVFSPYPDLPSYFLTAMRLKEILAEKIAAMTQRSRGKDLFDVWFLPDRVELEEKLLKQKIKGENKENKVKLAKEVEYNRDLSDLLNNVPPYQKVKTTVEEELKKKGLEIG